jgi:hypothetical protein
MPGPTNPDNPVNVANVAIPPDFTASAENGRLAGLTSVTDSFGRVAVEADGPAMPSKWIIRGRLAGEDPIFNQLAGVYGQSDNQGVMGLTTSNSGTGVYGGNVGKTAPNGFGVRGETTGGVGVQGQSFGPGLAGKFIGKVRIEGDVEVTGDVILLGGNDCAEHFQISGAAPDVGSVMCIDIDGTLTPSQRAYDKKVAGVVSGAGSFRPGLVLGKPNQGSKSSVIALIGRVYCQADATSAPIEIGDLLTTADIEGHAMKAQDPQRAFGAVIGKAMGALPSGRGLIPVLIALQ